VDVGALVVADTEASELVEPGKRPLDDPTPPSQAAAMPRSARRQQRENVAGWQFPSGGLRVVRPIAQHAVRSTARASAFAPQRGNRIDEWQSFLRVMPVGPAQPDGERRAPAVADRRSGNLGRTSIQSRRKLD
jgi:hypothetical protein